MSQPKEAWGSRFGVILAVTGNYDLSPNRYKEIVHEEIQHRPPTEILASLARIEAEIQQGLTELETILK